MHHHAGVLELRVEPATVDRSEWQALERVRPKQRHGHEKRLRRAEGNLEAEAAIGKNDRLDAHRER